MKEAELRKHAKCNLCHRLILEGGVPLFWRVTIERFGLDMRAVEAQTGLAMMLGNAFLAGVMGPDRDMAKPVMDPATITVCESCCTKMTCVAAMAERAGP
jgi:hypothetical protein